MNIKHNPDFYDELAERTPLTDDELAQFRPLQEVMPQDFVDRVLAHQAERERLGFIQTKTRGKQKTPTKKLVTIRLSEDVLNKFKATGKGWQTRINEILQQHANSL